MSSHPPVSANRLRMMLQLLLSVLLLLSTLASPASAFDITTSCAATVPLDGVIPSSWTVRRFTLVVTDGTVTTLLDTTRPAVLANGTTPGPAIEVNEFDWLEITVVSLQVNESMTGIHWHGLHHRATSYSDGAPGITQCGIGPGQNLTYRYCAYPSGTYFWHGHNNLQWPAGLYGMLIINPYNQSSLVNPALYDADWHWMAADFYNTPMPTLLDWFLSPASQGTEPQPDTVTVNGAFSGTTHLYVSSTDTVLVRLVNAAALDMMTFSVDGVDMVVVQVDGSEVAPYPVTSLMLNCAQRATVLLNFSAFVQDFPGVSSIYFRVEQMSDFDFSTQVFSPPYEPNYVPQPLFLGVIHIDAANTSVRALPAYNVSEPLVSPANFSFADTNDLELQPLNWNSISYTYWGTDISHTAMPLPTSTMSLQISFANNAAGVNVAFINNVSFNMPGMDTLMASESMLPPLYQQIVDASLGVAVVPAFDPVIESMSANSSYYQIPTGGIVDVTLLNTDDGDHPFHLHGHHFWVIDASDYGTIGGAGFNEYLIRDTVTVPAGGFVVIRVPTNNPGAWMLHCHIDWHLAAGLGIMFMEGTSSLNPSFVTVPADHLALCDAHTSQQVISARDVWLKSATAPNSTLSSSSSSSSPSPAAPSSSSSSSSAASPSSSSTPFVAAVSSSTGAPNTRTVTPSNAASASAHSTLFTLACLLLAVWLCIGGPAL